ncbi:MFS transporter [Candidatus Woesearchaeota archaeon]|nr:MFS transporter [Candidatus Woesearchaeota archaeon]
MRKSLEKEVRDRFESGENIELIEQQLIEQGHLESDVVSAIHRVCGSHFQNKRNEHNKRIRKFFRKEVFDRAGYGFGSEQYINILFYQCGASLFLITLLNGLRTLVGTTFSSWLKSYAHNVSFDRKVISVAGFFLGFCFILMGFARNSNSLWLFFFAALLTAIGALSHGELYQALMDRVLREEKSGLINKVYQYGLMITITTLVLGAYIIDRFSRYTISINLFGASKTFVLQGQLLVFCLAGISFCISGLMLHNLEHTSSAGKARLKIKHHVKNYLKELVDSAKVLLNDKTVFVLMVAATITSLVQLLGNSFFGIYIFQVFNHIGFGGFLNVALVFVLGVIASILTPQLTRRHSKQYGNFPMLIFGTMLMAIMPLSYYYNPNLVSIAMGTIAGVIGGVIAGVAHSLLAKDLVPQRLQESYFGMSSLIAIIPYIIIIPIAAHTVANIGLEKLFLVLALTLVAVVVPLYFVLMIRFEKKRFIYAV